MTDSNIKNSLIIDLVLGGFLLLSFSILQRSSILYRFRLYSPTVTSPPPELDTAGLRSLWWGLSHMGGWLVQISQLLQ